MYQNHEKMLEDIQMNWKKSWLKYFFVFTDLAVVLNSPNPLNEQNFIKAYLNAWSITRYFFKYFINSKEQQQFDKFIARSQETEDKPNPTMFSERVKSENQKIQSFEVTVLQENRILSPDSVIPEVKKTSENLTNAKRVELAQANVRNGKKKMRYTKDNLFPPGAKESKKVVAHADPSKTHSV